jgi:hypothetical protein
LLVSAALATGFWKWASNDEGGEPDVVLARCGDTPALEVLAAVTTVQGVDGKELRGQPAAEQRPDYPDHSGQDQALLPAAGNQSVGDQERTG